MIVAVGRAMGMVRVRVLMWVVVGREDGLTAGQGILGKVRCCRGMLLDEVTDGLERGVSW
jgi:hypothetical protein